ncbi:hypothetical protein HK102_013300 [Quaeritorhiza haematococci]|nr:hypothetical protein HK102_013300 [Quaeritorhiza haematococci]
MAPNYIPLSEISKHNTRDDCWVILHNKVYNVTSFLDDHPGGSKVILREAGKDATAAFDPIHPKDIIERFLPKECLMGEVDPKDVVKGKEGEKTEEELKREKGKPSLDACLNLFDFEAVAKTVLKPEAWAYYSSGADDELTLRENHSAFHRIWLKPRVLVNVKNVNTQTTMLGTPCSLPIYISATALGKLGHPEGEVVLTRGAGTRGIIQMIPTLASCSLDEIVDAAIPGQTQWFQLYVNQDRAITAKLVKHAEARGCKALCITADAPALGRREKDMRTKFVDDAPDEMDSKSVNRSQGAARAISTFIDPSLSWDDLTWFRSITKLPIIIKGIQCGEDAVLAARAGVDGIIVSNHGGRQLDTSRSGIETLAEVMDHLSRAGLKNKLEVYVDGGIRRGTDVFKALALGAKGVGLGRPFLYAMAAYGQQGVERCIDLLKDELEMVMRLMGTPTLKDVGPHCLLTHNLPYHVGEAPRDVLSDLVYSSLETPIKAKL